MLDAALDRTQIPAHPSIRVPRIIALSGAAALGLATALATPAWAHDSLIASTPEAGEVLTENPDEVVLEFSGSGLTVGETITNTIWVTDAEGENWETDIEVDGSTMSTELTDELPNGEYEVIYRVVYSDGHNEESSFSFEVDAPVVDDADSETPEVSAPPTANPTVDTNSESGDEATEDPGESPVSDTAAADEASSEQDPVQEDQFPVWAAVAIGAGALIVMAAVVILVRQKLKKSDGGEEAA